MSTHKEGEGRTVNTDEWENVGVQPHFSLSSSTRMDEEYIMQTICLLHKGLLCCPFDTKRKTCALIHSRESTTITHHIKGKYALPKFHSLLGKLM